MLHNLKIKKQFLYFLILVFLFRGMLDYVYFSCLSRYYAYALFFVHENVVKYLISFLLMGLIAMFIPYRVKRISDFGVLIVFLFITIPTISYWALADRANEYIVIVSSSTILLAALARNKIIIRLPYFREQTTCILLICSICLTMFFLNAWHQGIFANMSLDLFKGLYQRRYEFSVLMTKSFMPIISYVTIWLFKIINPAIIGFFFIKKRWFMVILFLTFQILGFSVTTNKEFLIYPFIMFFAFFLVKNKENMPLYLIGSLIIMLLLNSVYLSFGGLYKYVFLLTGRTFYSPAINNFEYYKFFQTNSFTLWSNSFLKRFINYPYSKPIPLIVGEDRWRAEIATFANTGYIASGYMHIGMFGVLIYTVILVLILILMNSIMERQTKNYPIMFGIAMISLLQLVNADLPTAFLTHGIGIGMLIMFLLREKTDRRFLKEKNEQTLKEAENAP